MRFFTAEVVGMIFGDVRMGRSLAGSRNPHFRISKIEGPLVYTGFSGSHFCLNRRGGDFLSITMWEEAEKRMGFVQASLKT